MNSLTDAATDAVATLRELLLTDSERVRLAAGKAILDSTLKYREREWNSRLDQREAKVLAQTLIEAVNNIVPDETTRRLIALELQKLVTTND
jgi:hypothetical protein